MVIWPKQGPLEQKWGSHSTTGIYAEKGSETLALWQGLDEEFAIVRLYAGIHSVAPIEVVKEIKTSSLKKATKEFNKVAQVLGFTPHPSPQTKTP